MLDLIDEVGPGGHFIATRETAERCREEIWMPHLFDRDPWEMWSAAGKQTVVDRIGQRLRSILDTHEPPPLLPGVEAQIEEILRAAEARHTAPEGGRAP